MAAFSVDLLAAYYVTRSLESAYPHFIGADFLLPFIYGPVFFLYAKTLTEGRSRLKLHDLIHFIPFLAAGLFLIPFYAQSGSDKLLFSQSPESHPWTPWLIGLNYIKLVYSPGYLLAIFILLQRHRKRLKATFSSIERINLAWLRNVMLGGVLTWAIAVVFFFFHSDVGGTEMQDPISRGASYVSIALACFVYAIGYLGLRQPEIFAPGSVHDQNAGSSPGYARSGMGEEASRRLQASLVSAMEKDRLYRNSNLTLSELAGSLSATPHNLSEVINTGIGLNFYDFINSYRVEEVKKRLADPDSSHLTLLAIGMEAGFNSKSSFNAVFKKHASMTPSEYRKRLRPT